MSDMAYDLCNYTMDNRNNSEARPTLETVQSLVRAGDYKAAAVLCERLCGESGVDARVWQILGAIHGENDNIELAEACTRRALSIDPVLGTAHRNLATLLMRQNKLKEAERCLRYALTLRPDDAVLHYELGNALRVSDRDYDAITAYRQAIRVNPQFPDAYFRLGNVFQDLKDFDSALGCARAAYACDSGFMKAKVMEATILERQGDYEEAWLCLSLLVEKEIVTPQLALAFAAVSIHVGKELEAIDYIVKTINTDKSRELNNAWLYMKLGELQERMERYDAAFQNYSKGNALAETPNNASEFIARMQLFRKVYSKDAMALMRQTESAGDGLVFIVGMPRSGTSLVEQILSAHTKVRACGELEFLTGIAKDVLQEIHEEGTGGGRISDLKLESVEHYRLRYMNAIWSTFGSMERLTDKLPHNFLNLGLIDVLFPGAHVIHCRRNPLDTCVSCYSKSFDGDDLSYTNDLESLGKVYREYDMLMDYWKDTLSVKIIDIQYESVVEGTEEWVRKILEFCGLEWEDKCLEFYKEKRQVHTASYNQIRQPVYNSSLNRWMRFDKALGPLRETLGELAGGD